MSNIYLTSQIGRSAVGTVGLGPCLALSHAVVHQFVSGPAGSFWLGQLVYRNISAYVTAVE